MLGGGRRGKATGSLSGPGDGKAQAAIDKAEAKLIASDCKACGGVGDKDGNGSCDAAGFFPPTQIGVPADCPAVHVPGGQDCGAIGALTTLDKLLACEACVTEFKVDCVTPATVPHDQPYPAACNAPVCGNGHVEPGETCDDGNTANGDACPANCVIASCTPAGTMRNVTVSFSGSNVAGLTVYLEYPEGKVSLPGMGSDQSVQDRISGTPSNSLTTPNDLDYALIMGVVKTTAIPQGQLFIAQFDNCTGAQRSTSAEFPCTVTDASDPNGTTLTSVTCSAVVS